MHSLLDWLALIALLELIGIVAVVTAVSCLARRVERQFTHHDRDLRAEIERISADTHAMRLASDAHKGLRS